MGEVGPCIPLPAFSPINSEIHYDRISIAGQQGRSERDRDLEPGLHAVLAPRGHGHGLRASDVHSLGQDVELRHGRVQADLRRSTAWRGWVRTQVW